MAVAFASVSGRPFTLLYPDMFVCSVLLRAGVLPGGRRVSPNGDDGGTDMQELGLGARVMRASRIPSRQMTRQA